MSEYELLREQHKSLEKRVSSIESRKHELTKLGTLMEIQVEMNKDQDEFLREQSLTLVKMNENLTTLNQVTNKLDGRLEHLENKFADGTIEDLRTHFEKEKGNSIHVPQLIKHITFTLITTAAIAGVTYIALAM